MKTSLGIWAFGPMITRFVPGGYQPQYSYDTEPVAEKVHRAIEGRGDLIDGYEFHYPDELSPENLDEVQAALVRAAPGPRRRHRRKTGLGEKVMKFLTNSPPSA